jgi:hypothetical protein
MRRCGGERLKGRGERRRKGRDRRRRGRKVRFICVESAGERGLRKLAVQRTSQLHRLAVLAGKKEVKSASSSLSAHHHDAALPPATSRAGRAEGKWQVSITQLTPFLTLPCGFQISQVSMQGLILASWCCCSRAEMCSSTFFCEC